MDNAPELIQSAEAAAILGEPQTTFNRKAAAGDYPVVTKLAGPTGARLFDKATIVAIAESRIEAAATRIRAASYDSDRGVPNGTPHLDTTQQEASDDSDPIEGDAADHGDGLLGHDEDETADEDASDTSERVATTPVDDGSTVTASATRSTFAEGVTDSTSAPEPVAPSVASFREGMHDRINMRGAL